MSEKGKDPAFLFYYQDFITGTMHMTDEARGVYIMLLCYQADKGYIDDYIFKKTCGSEEIFKEVCLKFEYFHEDKIYQNIRLRKEMEKRRQYSDSRRKNRTSKKAKPRGKLVKLGGSEQ